MWINYFTVASVFALGRTLVSLMYPEVPKSRNLVLAQSLFFAPESFQVQACSLPDKLAESFVVGESAVILLCEDMINILHAPVFQELSR